jgi:hypothetical protein
VRERQAEEGHGTVEKRGSIPAPLPAAAVGAESEDVGEEEEHQDALGDDDLGEKESSSRADRSPSHHGSGTVEVGSRRVSFQLDESPSSKVPRQNSTGSNSRRFDKLILPYLPPFLSFLTVFPSSFTLKILASFMVSPAPSPFAPSLAFVRCALFLRLCSLFQTLLVSVLLPFCFLTCFSFLYFLMVCTFPLQGCVPAVLTLS